VKLAGRGSVPRCTDDEGVGQVAVPDRDLAYSLKRPAGRYWRCSDLRNRVIELLEPTRRGGKVLRRPTPASVLRRWLRLPGRIGLALPRSVNAQVIDLGIHSGGAGNRTRVLRRLVRASPCAVR
jgi:hypothetical protein